jgi:hypothetical protein
VLLGLKKLLFFCFTQKRFKLFILSIVVSSCFLFSHFAVFAVSLSTYYELQVASLEARFDKISPDLNLTETELRSYGIWFSNLHSTNDHIFKRALKTLHLSMDRKAPDLTVSFAPGYYSITRELANILGEIGEAPLVNLRKKIFSYFGEFFGDNLVSIEFFERPGGVQLGQRARITLRGIPNTIDYYVKTHRGGLRSPTMTSGSADPKPVDPKELFVYKVLELIGLTPETHFLFGEEGATDFYIATKDAGFDELTREQGRFLTYERLKETQPGYTKIADISKLWDDEDQEKTLEAANELEKDLGEVELNIIRGLATADILSRIFLLSDFTANGGNIGFVSDGTLAKFRIIDFVTPHIGGEYRVQGPFAGFLDGNSMCFYMDSSDPPVRYVLYSRHLFKRVCTVKESLRELTVTVSENRPLNNDTLDEASRYVRKVITDSSVFSREQEDLVLKDLDRYVEGVRSNLRGFIEGLSSYTADQIHRVGITARSTVVNDGSAVTTTPQQQHKKESGVQTSSDDSQVSSGDDASTLSAADGESSSGNHYAAIDETIMHSDERINMLAPSVIDELSLDAGIVSSDKSLPEIYSGFDERLLDILHSAQHDVDDTDAMKKLEELEKQIEDSQLTFAQKKELRNRIEAIKRLFLEDTYAHVSEIERIIDVDTKMDSEKMARIFGGFIIQDPSEKTHYNGTNNYFDSIRPVNSEIRQILGSVAITNNVGWDMSSSSLLKLGLLAFDKKQLPLVDSVERGFANRISFQ